MKTLLTMGETMACMVPDADGPLRYVDRQARDSDAMVQSLRAG